MVLPPIHRFIKIAIFCEDSAAVREYMHGCGLTIMGVSLNSRKIGTACTQEYAVDISTLDRLYKMRPEGLSEYLHQLFSSNCSFVVYDPKGGMIDQLLDRPYLCEYHPLFNGIKKEVSKNSNRPVHHNNHLYAAYLTLPSQQSAVLKRISDLSSVHRDGSKTE